MERNQDLFLFSPFQWNQLSQPSITLTLNQITYLYSNKCKRASFSTWRFTYYAPKLRVHTQQCPQHQKKQFKNKKIEKNILSRNYNYNNCEMSSRMWFGEDFYAQNGKGVRRYVSCENGSAREEGKVNFEIWKKWNKKEASFMGCSKSLHQSSPHYHPNY